MSPWKTVRLGDVAEFVRGITFKPSDVVPIGETGSVACLRTKNVQTELDCSDVWGINERFVKREDQFLRAGDILVSTANSWNLVGKCCWIPELPWRATFGGFVSVLRPRPGMTNSRFLFRWFSSDRIQAKVRSFGQQTTNISNLNIGRCLKLSLPLPSLAEQGRIAKVLDQAEVLRTQRRATLAQLDTLASSIFLEMFGDPISNPKDWPIRKIGEIGQVVTGNTPPRSNQDYYGTAIEWIKSDNINTPHYYLTRAAEGLSPEGKNVARTVPAGSILITCIAGSPECIGNAGMADREVAFNQQINALVPKVGDPHFLYVQILVGKRLVQQASTASMKGMVSKSRLAQVPLMFPPLKLQHDFARRVAAVEKLKAAHRASIDKLDELFASLQHRAFRGEL